MLVVFGSVAFDTIRTPTKVLKCEIGAATYASISASFFTKTGLLAVIGKDFPKKYSNVLAKRMNLRGLSIKDGKTFRYDVSDCKNTSLLEISKKVKRMIQDAVLSFAELDIRKAQRIHEDEEFIDRLYKNRLPALIESKDTKCALAEALLLRYLERIGDHAVFMSDAINYIVTGKHRPTQKQIDSHTK